MARATQHLLETTPDDGFTPKELSRQEFGRRLQSEMLARNWNQSDLARHSGVGRDAISTYIRGRSFPEPKNLAMIAAAFGVKPQDIYPNTIARAIDAENPAIEIRQAAGHPDKVWLRVNRLVDIHVAAEVFGILTKHND